MESKRIKKQLKFLPNYFKKLGVVIIVLSLIPPIIIKSLNIEIIQSQRDLLKIITLDLLILGLFLIGMSRDKVEDEMTIDIRLKAMAWTFSWAVIYVILQPFVYLLFKDPVQDLTGQQVVVSMLFVYMIMFYLQKKGR